ncbi:ABC transporter ATP-binding protein [Urbifossiella limnaea]|uniref:Teichoic acids export ATP-binding protein TagH n=1 Tax=Urbifossiella limnaea TaxID=2528023 RepID=A0A517XME6_9BACT|nr:ABC transporter ATP-binding protein [Urbifossiella limnaea]QDU18685.1 Teichoic acids export ATP-binding protein TagH [Urbifossiella limnaea]
MKPAIRVEGLGKRYRLGSARSGNNFTEALRAAARRAVRRAPAAKPTEFWALRDVSFEVQPGEIVGVIGRNGAGKSTLLKVLSRIVEPTDGRAELRGRLGSLLEVGTGFHPELTGRENVFLNGSVLGMSRREIARKFDEIVAFSEVEAFLDTPVKRYSSGMYVRLAFAVAAHLEPEILVVDEVLAVGDQQFQEKCLGTLKSVSRGGRTVLFVSHSMTTVQAVCSRAIVLAGGRVTLDGTPSAAVREYLKQADGLAAEWLDDRPADPSKDVMIRSARVRRADGTAAAQLAADQPFDLEIGYEVSRPTTAQIAFRVNRDDGLTVFTTGDGDAAGVFCRPQAAGRHVGRVRVPGHFLAPGRYHLLVAANRFGAGTVDVVDPVLNFEVDAAGSLQTIEGRLGVVLPRLEWTTGPAGGAS